MKKKKKTHTEKEMNAFLDYGLYLKSYGYALCIKKKSFCQFNQNRHKIKPSI